MNNIYLLVGASGSGKTTIQEMLNRKHNLKPLYSYTTRPPRKSNEVGHIFISNEEFAQLQNMVAYTRFCDYEYCATSTQVDNSDIYVIDPAGVEFFKKAYRGKKGIKVIYISSPLSVRFNRMEQRGDKFEKCLERVVNDVVEFNADRIKSFVDYEVVNDDNTNLNSVCTKIWDYIRECENK